jgi:hypothetical protein
METSREFLKYELTKLKEYFPLINLRYQFDKNDKTHIIEIMPLEYFEKNESYIEKEADLSYRFEQIFQNESIMFVSGNSLTKINNPEEL